MKTCDVYKELLSSQLSAAEIMEENSHERKNQYKKSS